MLNDNSNMEGGAPTQVAEPTGPLEDRLVSKTWKWRQSAFEELENLFRAESDSNAPIFNQYGSTMPKFLKEKNAFARDNVVNATKAFIEKASVSTELAAAIAKGLVENCLGGRPNTKQTAEECLLLIIEIDEGEAAINAILAGCAHKTPKVRIACIELLLESLKQFGASPLPIKTILKALPKFFEDRDNKVRKFAMDLAVELHRHVGAVVASQLKDLRSAQLDELNKQWESISAGSAAPPSRRTRSDQSSQPIVSSNDNSNQEQSNNSIQKSTTTTSSPMALDAFDLADEVDVLRKMPKSFYKNIGSTKWKERKAEIETFVQMLEDSAPKYSDGNYSEIVTTLRKVIAQDSNVMIVAKAANGIALLARGLRTKFSNYSRSCVESCLSKFKEKKSFVVSALHDCLDALLEHSIGLHDIVDEVKTMAKSSTPSIRKETLVFLARAVRNAGANASLRKELKSLGMLTVSLVDKDTLPDVRGAAADATAALAITFGVPLCAPLWRHLEAVKVANIDRAIKKAQSTPQSSGNASKPTATSRPKPSSSTSSSSSSSSSAVGNKPSRRPQRPVAARKPAASQPSGAKTSTATTSSSPNEREFNTMPLQSADTALENVAELLPANIPKLLSSKKWSERKEGMEALLKWTQVELNDADALAADTVARLLQSSPGWKESNFQVYRLMCDVMKSMAIHSRSFSIPTAHLIIPALVGKLGDIKCDAQAQDALEEIAAKVGVYYVSERILKLSSAEKSPKIHCATCVVIERFLKVFGKDGDVALSAAVKFGVEGLDGNNPTFKAAASDLLNTLRAYVPKIALMRQITAGARAAVVQTLQARFDAEAAPSPSNGTRQSTDNTTSTSSSSVVASSNNVCVSLSGAKPVQNDYPPAESIEADLAPFVPQLSAGKWQDRRDALASIAALIPTAEPNGAPSIAPTIGDLPSALDARLADSNRNLQRDAAVLCGNIASAMGAKGVIHVELLVPPLFKVLSDNKKALRDAASEALDRWAEAVGAAALVEHAASPLETDSSMSRRGALQWITTHCQSLDKNNAELDAIAAPLVAALSDRAADVRHSAVDALAIVYRRPQGRKLVANTVESLPKASRLAVEPLIANIGTNASSNATSSSTTTTTTTTAKRAPVKARATRPVSASSSAPSDAEYAVPPAGTGLSRSPPRSLPSDVSTPPAVAAVAKETPVDELSSPALAAAASKSVGAFTIDDSDDESDDDDDIVVNMAGPKSAAASLVSKEAKRAKQAQRWLAAVREGEPTKVIEALKQFCAALSSPDGFWLYAKLDAMVEGLAALLPIARAELKRDSQSDEPGANGSRLYKYLLNALRTALGQRSSARMVGAAALQELLRQLLTGIVQPSLRVHPDGATLIMAINQLVIGTLENCALSDALEGLLAVLCDAARDTKAPPRLAETAARALLKLAKSKLDVSSPDAATLPLGGVLGGIHKFLHKHPPRAWPSNANFELRAVKTLIHALVAARGDDVAKALPEQVPIKSSPTPVIVGYVHVMLQDRRARAQQSNQIEKKEESINNTTNNIVESNVSNKAESSDATVENTAPNETSVVSSGSNETNPNPNASIADLRERLQRIKSQI